MDVTRRNYLGAAVGSLLAASALALPGEADEGKSGSDTLYGNGMVWNRELPGVLGDLRLSFDVLLDLVAGTGQGTADDPDYPAWGIHFSIASMEQDRRPRGETRFTMHGRVTAANDPEKIGLSVRMIAETVGDTTAIAIALGDHAFGGAGLVVTLNPGDKLFLILLGILAGL